MFENMPSVNTLIVLNIQQNVLYESNFQMKTSPQILATLAQHGHVDQNCICLHYSNIIQYNTAADM